MRKQALRAARCVAAATGLAALLNLCPLTAQDVGWIGPDLAGSGPSVGSPSVTESKPQNKVWFNNRRWWASLWSSSALAFHIHRLDLNTHQWIDTGVPIDTRPDSHSDTLWDGTKLYVVTHEYASGSSPGDPILLLRFSYANGSYALDAGFPLAIGDSSTESAMIEKDSTGRLWAVWKQDLRVYYAYSLGSEALWSVPAPLPGCTSDFDQDDICAIQRFGGNKIGVMWNDNVQADFLFAVHQDGQPPTTWLPNEIAWDGQSDDHINLAAGSGGRIYAAVKNDNEEVFLLTRNPSTGAWAQHRVTDDSLANRLSRPIVLLNEVDQTIQVFAAFDGAIYRKTSPIGTIAFPPGPGTVVLRDADGALNNPTSTRQNFTPTTGLVVLAASTSQTGNYWHHEVPPASTPLVLNAPTPGSAGAVNTFVASGAAPNALVVLVGSPTTGNKLIVLPGCGAGVPSGLGPTTVLIGYPRANASGIATTSVSVPITAAGATFHFQAFEVRGCRASNRVTEVF